MQIIRFSPRIVGLIPVAFPSPGGPEGSVLAVLRKLARDEIDMWRAEKFDF